MKNILTNEEKYIKTKLELINTYGMKDLFEDEEFLKMAILMKETFGNKWLSMIQKMGTYSLENRVGQDLTSFMSFPERGNGGSSQWRGNCSPEVVRKTINYCKKVNSYERKQYRNDNFIVLDPMSGSGTTSDVCDQMGIESISLDLNPNPKRGIGNWNALKNELPCSADLIFWHPPYHDIIQYSGKQWGNSRHSDDLSNCENWDDFIEKMNYVTKKLYMALRDNGMLAILVGDIRSKGTLYSMQDDMMKIGKYESFIVKAQHNCISDNRSYNKPFIPIVTEYLMLFRKVAGFMVSFTKTVRGEVDIRKSTDASITWNTLIRTTMENMGGTATLKQLYCALEKHPKSQKNKNYDARIRATIYQNTKDFVKCDSGKYKLSYVA